MTDSFSTLSFLAGSLAGSMLVAFGWFWLRRPRNATQLLPCSKVRLRTEAGVFRTNFLSLEKSGWVLSAPLSRDNYVPLREGEQVIVEASTPQGLLVFRTTVAER